MGRSRLGGKRMTLRKWMRTAACLALTAGMTMAAADDADAKRVRWKMHSAFGGKLIVLGEGAKNIADPVTEMSGGEVTLKYLEPGAMVTGTAYYDQVSSGALAAAFGTPGSSVHNKTPYPLC